MAYVTPSGSAVNFQLTENDPAYAAPLGNAANLQLTEWIPVFTIRSKTTLFIPNTDGFFTLQGKSDVGFVSYNPRLVIETGSTLNFVGNSRAAASFTAASATSANFDPAYAATISGASTPDFRVTKVFGGRMSVAGRTTSAFKGQFEFPVRIHNSGGHSLVRFKGSWGHAADFAVTNRLTATFTSAALKHTAFQAAGRVQVNYRLTAGKTAVATIVGGSVLSGKGETGKLGAFAIGGGSSSALVADYELRSVLDVAPYDEQVFALSQRKTIYVFQELA